ncbi:hypothetical protein KI387_001246, partial [Taxus chinensis]
INLRVRVSIRIGIIIKHAMTRMKDILKEVVAEVKDTMVDLESEAMVVDEVSFLMEH